MFISQKVNNSLVTNEKGVQDKEAAQNSQSAQSGKMMMYTMPLMTLFIGYSMTAAMSLYWLIQGIVGTVLAGWLSDKVFNSDRVKPAILSGIVSFIALALFLFTEGSYIVNILYVSLFSLAVGVLYCIVAGLMAVDIVPRKATGAALGVVGISSYIAAGLQDITSGYLIQYNTVNVNGTDVYDFMPVSWFWLGAALISFLLPVLNWKKMKNRTNY
jgi:OPA family sugar phosphate sensor protein UhpC-like MFS transporter